MIREPSQALCKLCFLVFSLVLLHSLPARAQGTAVDLELVLAVDSSSSVTAEEFDLQMRGIAEAFRHSAVVAAIEAAGDLGVAVSLVQWSDNRRQFLAVDWMHLTDAESAEAFAEEIDATPRFLIGGGTAIGGAMSFSTRLMRSQRLRRPAQGRRHLGRRPGEPGQPARRTSATRRWRPASPSTAWPSSTRTSCVDRYYLYNVIGGTGAFLVTAADFQDFQEAILRKADPGDLGGPAGRPGAVPQGALGRGRGAGGARRAVSEESPQWA